MFDADRGVTVYFELDTTGNVRRLHAGERVTGLGAFSGDLGGYSYTAFGRNIPSSEPGGLAIPKIDAVDYFQRLQWQGRWLYNRSGGLYDFRARFWSPQLGAFLQLDRYQFLSSGGTLWSWPGQNPFRLRDPSGRYGWEDFGNDFYKHSETAIDVSLSLSFAAGTIATGGLLVEVLGLGTLEAGLTTLGAEALGFGGSLLARTAAAATSAAAMVGRGCSTKGSDNSLIGQLAAQGVKHSPEKIAAIEKIGEKIVFLENGSSRAGLTHIIERHAGDFASRGISAAQIPDAIMGALRNGTVVGMQGTRPIYEFVFNGQVQRIAVTVSDNGYVVGANPAGL